MIVVKTLRIKNGLSFGKAKLNFDQPGLNLVLGENGVGKSNLFEILSHVTYGSTGKSLRANDLVHWHSDEGFSAKLNIFVHEKQLSVHQWRGKPKVANGMEVTFDGANLSSDLRGTQNIIAEKLGITEFEWDCFCYLIQGAVHPFLEVGRTSKSKRELLSSIYGLRFDDYSIVTKKLLVESQEELTVKDAGITAKLEQIREQITAIPVDALETRKTTLEKSKAKLSSKLKSLQEELKSSSSKETLLAEKKRLKIELGNLVEPEEPAPEASIVRDLKAKLVELRKESNTAERSEKLNSRLKKFLENLPDYDIMEIREKLKKSTDSYNKSVEKLTILEESSERVDEILTLTQGENPNSEEFCYDLSTRQRVLEQVEKISVELKVLDEQLVLVNLQNCPTCLQVLPKSFSKESLTSKKNKAIEVLEKSKNELIRQDRNAEVSKILKTLKVDPMLYGEEKAVAEQDKIKHKNRISKYTEFLQTKEKVNELREELRDLGKVRELSIVAASIKEADKQLTNFENLIANWNRYKTEKSTLGNSLTENLKLLERYGEVRSVDEVTSELVEVEQKLDNITSELATVLSDIELVKKLRIDRKNLKAKREQLEDLRQKVRKYEILSFVFGPKGFEYRIAKIVEHLNHNLDRYIPILFPEYAKGFRCYFYCDKQDIYLYCKTVEEAEATMTFLSGGERRKIAIAATLALRDFLPPSKQINILILDEFDTHCTDENRQRILEALEEHSRLHPRVAIWVVTHSKEAQVSPIWNRVFTVLKENGVSRLEQTVTRIAS